MSSTTNPPINNIVVLMLENRSYDNVLGMLYQSTNPPPFNVSPPGQNLNGVANALPNLDITVSPAKSYSVWGSPSDATTIPQTDPGELFEDMAQQFLGQPKAASSVYDDSPYPPGNPPTAPLSTPQNGLGLMQGFVTNFAQKYGETPESPGDVMHCYVPSLMPATAWLANQFMVCDSWFASVPTQTWVNRLFSLCGTSYEGKLDDSEFFDGNKPISYPISNIFEMLDKANPDATTPNWKIYFHDYSISAMAIQYVNGYLTDQNNVNLANFSGVDYPSGTQNPLKNAPTTFLQDIIGETLAPFSLIEPRYSNSYPGMASGLSPNSNHPGLANYLFNLISDDPPIDVLDGERLLLEVYLALRLSKYWDNTLLIVTYDEPGGLYDHVPPLPAIPPDSTKALNGFEFNWFGGRVPTIIVSPFAPPGSQLIAQQGTFDHTSIIATVLEYLAPKSTYFAGNVRIANAPAITASNGLNGSGDNSPDAAEVPRWQRVNGAVPK